MAEQFKDEIDLTDLILRVKHVLFGNRIIIIVLFVLGIVGGLIYANVKAPTYQNDVVVRASILNMALVEILNENLTALIDDNNMSALAKKLNTEKSIVSGIKKISITPAEDNFNEKLGYAFYIVSVEASINDHWSTIEQGILHYISNNPYVKKRINLRQSQYQDFIAKLDFEIAQIDSLKGGLSQRGSVNKDNIVLMNPGEVYTALLELYEQKQELEQELEFNQAVEVVENFEARSNPVSLRPVFSVAIGGVIGLFIGLFIAFGRALNSYLKSYESTQY